DPAATPNGLAANMVPALSRLTKIAGARYCTRKRKADGDFRCEVQAALGGDARASVVQLGRGNPRASSCGPAPGAGICESLDEAANNSLHRVSVSGRDLEIATRTQRVVSSRIGRCGNATGRHCSDRLSNVHQSLD